MTGRVLRIAVLLALTLAVTGCAGSPLNPQSPTGESKSHDAQNAMALASSVAQKYGLTLGGLQSSGNDVVPADLESNAMWAVTQPTLLANGYDLRPFTGRTVRFDTYAIKERYERSPVVLVVVSCGGGLVGAYASATDYVPGPISMREFGHPAQQE